MLNKDLHGGMRLLILLLMLSNTVLHLIVFVQLRVDSVWLREASGTGAFFPDTENLMFDLTPDIGILTTRLVVEGVPLRSTPGVSRPARDRIPAPLFTTTTKKPTSTFVKIVRATIKKGTTSKPEFIPIAQEHVEVKTSTANIGFLTRAAQEKWGEDIILVSVDGIPFMYYYSLV